MRWLRVQLKADSVPTLESRLTASGVMAPPWGWDPCHTLLCFASLTVTARCCPPHPPLSPIGERTQVTGMDVDLWLGEATMGAKTPSTKTALCVEDWLQLPEGPPFYELEDGRLLKMPSPRREHQEIVGLLFAMLRQFAREHDLGTVVMEVDVALPTVRGYIPDIAFVSRSREEASLGRDGKVHGAPDVVVEVVSPGTRSRDRYRKLREFWEAGVLWYWLVDSEALGFEEFQHTAQGYLCATTAAPGEIFASKAFPGLRIDLVTLIGETRPSTPTRRRQR